jgi:hypothetical protein
MLIMASVVASQKPLNQEETATDPVTQCAAKIPIEMQPTPAEAQSYGDKNTHGA